MYFFWFQPLQCYYGKSKRAAQPELLKLLRAARFSINSPPRPLQPLLAKSYNLNGFPMQHLDTLACGEYLTIGISNRLCDSFVWLELE